MLVVIFKARGKTLDQEYSETAAQLRDMALTEFGCLEFHAVDDGEQEIALSYWPDEESIRRWKQQADHLIAQRHGREKWYLSYQVQVANIERDYSFSATD